MVGDTEGTELWLKVVMVSTEDIFAGKSDFWIIFFYLFSQKYQLPILCQMSYKIAHTLVWHKTAFLLSIK